MIMARTNAAASAQGETPDLFEAPPAKKPVKAHRKQVAVRIPPEVRSDPSLLKLLEVELSRARPRAGYIAGIAIATKDEGKHLALRSLAKAVEEKYGYVRGGSE